MKRFGRFEDLDIWTESMSLCITIYRLMAKCNDFGFRNQIQRAAVSIPSNISEGFERQTNKEFVQFLYIAKGSCGELRTQICLAKELNYINTQEFNILFDKAKHLSSMLYNFIKVRTTSA